MPAVIVQPEAPGLLDLNELNQVAAMLLPREAATATVQVEHASGSWSTAVLTLVYSLADGSWQTQSNTLVEQTGRFGLHNHSGHQGHSSVTGTGVGTCTCHTPLWSYTVTSVLL